jgi:hypothetical protein
VLRARENPRAIGLACRAVNVYGRLQAREQGRYLLRLVEHDPVGKLGQEKSRVFRSAKSANELQICLSDQKHR